MCLVRLSDWERRLSALIEEWRHTPYAYGRADCARFAQAHIAAITGTELLPGLKRPESWLEAAKFMIRHGYTDVEDMATKLLGPPLQRTAFARRGDLVSYEACGEAHLAVSIGAHAVTPGPEGLSPVPMAAWVKGWKIG